MDGHESERVRRRYGYEGGVACTAIMCHINTGLNHASNGFR